MLVLVLRVLHNVLPLLDFCHLCLKLKNLLELDFITYAWVFSLVTLKHSSSSSIWWAISIKVLIFLLFTFICSLLLKRDCIIVETYCLSIKLCPANLTLIIIFNMSLKCYFIYLLGYFLYMSNLMVNCLNLETIILLNFSFKVIRMACAVAYWWYLYTISSFMELIKIPHVMEFFFFMCDMCPYPIYGRYCSGSTF